MDNLDKIKYKDHPAPGVITKIDLVAGTKADITEKNAGLWAEKEAWLKIPGNEIEPVFTDDEQLIKDEEDSDNAKNLMVSERNAKILEADKWELPTVMQRFNLTTQQILEYKQVLLDITITHTTIEQFLNPEWPEKLIAQELL